MVTSSLRLHKGTVIQFAKLYHQFSRESTKRRIIMKMRNKSITFLLNWIEFIQLWEKCFKKVKNSFMIFIFIESNSPLKSMPPSPLPLAESAELISEQCPNQVLWRQSDLQVYLTGMLFSFGHLKHQRAQKRYLNLLSEIDL